LEGAAVEITSRTGQGMLEWRRLKQDIHVIDRKRGVGGEGDGDGERKASD
jgi:hypothetical protein